MSSIVCLRFQRSWRVNLQDDDSWLNKNDPAIDTNNEDYEEPDINDEDYEESDEDIDTALYEGGDPDGIMLDCRWF